MRPCLPVLCLILSIPAEAALAACPGDLVLSCPIGKKQLDLCLTASSLTYSFGPAGRPELTLTVPILEAEYTPWSGVGSAMWDAVSFANKDVTYEVWTSTERNAENPVTEGGVNVIKGRVMQAQLTCAPGTVTSDLYAIFTAKEAAGQCWDLNSFSWQTAPCP